MLKLVLASPIQTIQRQKVDSIKLPPHKRFLQLTDL